MCGVDNVMGINPRRYIIANPFAFCKYYFQKNRDLSPFFVNFLFPKLSITLCKALRPRQSAPQAHAFPRGEGGFFDPTKEGRKRRMRNAGGAVGCGKMERLAKSLPLIGTFPVFFCHSEGRQARGNLLVASIDLRCRNEHCTGRLPRPLRLRSGSSQ